MAVTICATESEDAILLFGKVLLSNKVVTTSGVNIFSKLLIDQSKIYL